MHDAKFNYHIRKHNLNIINFKNNSNKLKFDWNIQIYNNISPFLGIEMIKKYLNFICIFSRKKLPYFINN